MTKETLEGSTAEELLGGYTKTIFSDMPMKKNKLENWNELKEYWHKVNPLIKKVAIINHMEYFASFCAKKIVEAREEEREKYQELEKRFQQKVKEVRNLEKELGLE